MKAFAQCVAGLLAAAAATSSAAHGFAPAAVPDGVLGTVYVLALLCGCACLVLFDMAPKWVWVRRASVLLACGFAALAFALSLPAHA